jgi:hypothetical protein
LGRRAATGTLADHRAVSFHDMGRLPDGNQQQDGSAMMGDGWARMSSAPKVGAADVRKVDLWVVGSDGRGYRVVDCWWEPLPEDRSERPGFAPEAKLPGWFSHQCRDPSGDLIEVDGAAFWRWAPVVPDGSL